VVLPAGVLQPPFYSPRASVAVNFGATGETIGHELTHGFDDEGSQYDASGNLASWWEPDTRKRFEARTHASPISTRATKRCPVPGSTAR